MAQEHQYVCDGCLEVVHGRVAGKFFHRDYLNVKGTVLLQQLDQLGKAKWTYLTYANQVGSMEKPITGEDLTFCVKKGMPCFEKWCDRRRNELEFRRKQKREEELKEIRRQEILSGVDDDSREYRHR